MAKAIDTWEKVLMGRVAELEKKVQLHDEGIKETIEAFREWVKDADELDIYYDAEDRARKITKQRECYKAVWDRLVKAKSELETYRNVMDINESGKECE